MGKNQKKMRKRQQNCDKRQELLSRLSDKTMIPEDIMTGCCSMIATGQRELIIENYKSILEYQSDRLVVLTRQGRIEICGKKLEIGYYGKEEMKIVGKIESLFFRR